MKIKEYTRWCKQCKKYFKTEQYYSEVCEECKEANHYDLRLERLNLIES
jgi:Zn finger protein HypA/HybF involved in hydrogenase expression